VKLDYLVGTMIEVPRGALTADEIAETAQFFSFGTNDLTQTCLGMSRDDMGSFLQKYTDAGIFKANPFASIDVSGVGQLMKDFGDLCAAISPAVADGVIDEKDRPHGHKIINECDDMVISALTFRKAVIRAMGLETAR
jgi:pyruvate,orthophosphate dikinase